MKSRNEKNIYTYFSEYNRDLIECVYRITPMKIKEIFKKKWGPYLTGTIHTKLTPTEVELFNKYASWFESKLLIAKKLYIDGMNLKEISNYLVSGEIPIKPESQKNLQTYHNELDDLLKYYHITMAELEEIVEQLPREERISFIYYYGMEHSKYSMEKIASILNNNGIVMECTENDVKEYIESVYIYIREYQEKKKESFKNLSNENELIPIKVCNNEEEFSKKIDTRCKIDLKKNMYADHTEKDEKNTISNIAPVNSNYGQSKVDNKRITSQLKYSLYEGYAEEDKKYVTKVIEYWSKNNIEYYNLIKRVYGPTYDQLNMEEYYKLTPEEKEILARLKNNLKTMVERCKKREKLGASNISPKVHAKMSMHEGYVEEDTIAVKIKKL